MPVHKSVVKRMRQNERRRARNRAHRSYLRKEIKTFRTMNDTDSARERFPRTVSAIDKAAKKGIIHHRTAARLKSRLSRNIAGS